MLLYYLKNKSITFGFAFAVIFIFFTLNIFYIKSLKHEIQGDGHEYVLQSVSFQNHLTFGITEEDLSVAKSQFHENIEMLDFVYDRLIKDSTGTAYSNHFGVYSALVTPLKILFLSLHMYPLKAFCLMNLILWTFALLIILFCLDASDSKKVCLILLSIFNPALFYLNWIHTEIYCYSFILVGLVFFHNKKNWLSILFLSFAAMQNLAILPLSMVVGLDYIKNLFISYKENNKNANFIFFIRSNWLKIISYGLFYIPAFIPLIVTYLRFGTYNLVAKVAMENKYKLHKAFDYLFDPNLGIFPFEPFLLIFFFLICFVFFRSKKKSLIFEFLLSIVGILFIICHQIQINCGMQEIMRYCIFIIPIMIFFVIENIDSINKSLKLMFSFTTLESVYSFLLVILCLFGGYGYTYNQYAPWARFLLNNAPGLYNPSHGIFYSRTLGYETYYSKSPIEYYDNSGYVKKILLNKESEQFFYNENYQLYNEKFEIINKNDLRKKYIDEKDFSYININKPVRVYKKLDSDIIFDDEQNYNASKYFNLGLSGKENWGSWTDGNVVSASFFIESTEKIKTCNLEIGGIFYGPQRVKIIVNDKVVYENKIDNQDIIRFDFDNNRNGAINMEILLPDAIAPSTVTDSVDNRLLGLAMLKMSIK